MSGVNFSTLQHFETKRRNQPGKPLAPDEHLWESLRIVKAIEDYSWWSIAELEQAEIRNRV